MEISVIIPTMNRNIMLIDCLDSLIFQNFPKTKYEVIIINDGGNDKSGESIKSISDENKNVKIRYFWQKNKGPAAARNLGIRMAKGKILAFLDDDCIANKNWLASIYDVYNKNPDLDGAGGPIKRISNCLISKFEEKAMNNSIKTKVINNNYMLFSTGNASYKKSSLNNTYFDERFKVAGGEDTDFSFNLYLSGRKLLFSPKIQVKHNFNKKIRPFLVKYFNYGRGSYLFTLKWYNQIHHFFPEDVKNKSTSSNMIKNEKMINRFKLVILFILSHHIFYTCGGIYEGILSNKKKPIKKIRDIIKYIYFQISRMRPFIYFNKIFKKSV